MLHLTNTFNDIQKWLNSVFEIFDVTKFLMVRKFQIFWQNWNDDILNSKTIQP